MDEHAWMIGGRDAWIAEVTEWITERIDALTLDHPVRIRSIRERRWGAVLRVETPDRALFFKAEGPGARHEPVIVSDVASTHPWLVPDVIAADVDRAWLLMADHGSPMRDSVDPAGEIAVWEQIFPLYARMQRASASSNDRWIDAGTPDRRVDLLPALVEALLASDSVPLDQDKRRAIAAMLPNLARICGDLATTEFAHAIDHSDMHGGNVLLSGGTPRLIDWGDSCITHPFASLFVTYQHAVAKLPASERPAVARRLRDVYLEAWSEDASKHDLHDAFAMATWLGHVIRALNFAHQLGAPSEWGSAVATFLVRWQGQYELLGRDDELIMAVAGQSE